MKDKRRFNEVIHTIKGAEKDSFATEIICKEKRQRNYWMALAIVSILLNIIQWMF